MNQQGIGVAVAPSQPGEHLNQSGLTINSGTHEIEAQASPEKMSDSQDVDSWPKTARPWKAGFVSLEAQKWSSNDLKENEQCPTPQAFIIYHI